MLTSDTDIMLVYLVWFFIFSIILIIIWIIGFIYQKKLVDYLQKHKPTLFDKLVIKKERFVLKGDKSFKNKFYTFLFKIIIPNLPTPFMDGNKFRNYIFSKNTEDDSISRLYKRIVAISSILFALPITIFMIIVILSIFGIL